MSENVRFVRWQHVTIVQFGVVNNTVLALATASIGFALSREAPVGGWKLCSFGIGTALLSLSVLFALWCALNRLWDFRETAQIARGRMEECEKAAARHETKKLGARSWGLLYCQLGTFALGLLSLALVFAPFPS